MDNKDKKIEALENEIKILKNEIKETLTDVREYLLTNVENPFPIGSPRERPLRQIGERRAAVSDDGEDTVGMMGQQVISGRAEGGLGMASGDKGNGSGLGSEFVTIAGKRETGGTEATPAASKVELVNDDGATAGKASPLGGGRETSETRATSAASQVEPDNDQGAILDEISSASESGDENMDEMDEITDRHNGQSARKGGDTEPEEATDLVTVAMLVSWIDEGLRRIGQRRLKTIVEVYSSMGGLSNQLEGVLLKLISLDNGDGTGSNVSLKECLRVLADLDNLMLRSRFDRSGAALLSILLNGRQK